MTRAQVHASQLLLDLKDERDDVIVEYTTAIGDERRDYANLGAVLDGFIKMLYKIGAKDHMGEVAVDEIVWDLEPR